MQTYRLVPERDWLEALSALKGAMEALSSAGSMTLPGASTSSAIPLHIPRKAPNRTPEQSQEKLKIVSEIVARVVKGGPKHKPKAFDRRGPKISDFVYVLMRGRFKPPEAADEVGKYVYLNTTKRLASGQIRTALKNDEDRFRRYADGSYEKTG